MFILKSLFYRLYSVFISFNLKKIKIGRSVVISHDTIIKNNVALLDYARVFSSYIDSYSYISPFSIVINSIIGKYTSIGPGCKIGLGVHPIDQVSTSPYFYNDLLYKRSNKADFVKVTIGNDVWLGADVLVMGGISIGNGAVVGAGAVVTKDVPPYAIVCGVPAKILKYRFDEETIKNLELSKWWEIDHQKLMSKKANFKLPNEFLNKLEDFYK